jgi:hypothetical protein
VHAGHTGGTVGGPAGVSACELLTQRRFQRGGQHHDPILDALAFTHHDGAMLKLDILHAQAQPFEQTHSGAVEQAGNQSVRHGVGRRRVKTAEHASDLLVRQHHGQALLGPWAADLTHPRQVLPQHLLVEKQQR